MFSEPRRHEGMLQSWVKRSPRVVAGVWFAVAGFMPAAIWFLPSMTQHTDGWTVVWVIALPTGLAGVTGSVLGSSILTRPASPGRAVLRGAFVALIACVVGALFYALFSPRVTKSWATPGDVIGVMGMVLIVGVIATGWILVPIGGVAGLLLYLVARGARQGASKT